MNDVWLKTGLFGLNLALVTIAACSAESSTPAPSGPGTKNNTGGANSGTGGSGILPVGGAPAGTAGGKASGTAGTAPTAGTSPGTGGTGTGGTGGIVMACANKPAPAVPLIDDAEDGDNGSQLVTALMTGSYWFTYNDGTGTQMPAPDPMGLNPLIPTAGGATSPMNSIRTSGTAHMTWGAGLGLTLNQDQGGGGKKCTLDATAYQGIRFQAKSAAGEQVRVKIGVTATVGVADGGTCAAMCDDFGKSVLLTTAWAAYEVPFMVDATTAKTGPGISQEGWGTPATFSPATLMQVQFQVGKGLAFDFSIDDLEFY